MTRREMRAALDRIAEDLRVRAAMLPPDHPMNVAIAEVDAKHARRAARARAAARADAAAMVAARAEAEADAARTAALRRRLDRAEAQLRKP